jgi:hypothetical protein
MRVNLKMFISFMYQLLIGLCILCSVCGYLGNTRLHTKSRPFNFASELYASKNPDNGCVFVENDHHKETNHVLKAGSLIGSAVLFTMLSFTSAASAGYGPGGAAVISPPVIKQFSKEDLASLSQNKQLQRALGVTCDPKERQCRRNIDQAIRDLEFERKEYELQQKQLEAEKLENLERSLMDKIEMRTAEAAKRNQAEKQLELLLSERQTILDELAAQPAWVSYFAAGLGSVISTLVMHPLDTLKIRLMSNTKAGEDLNDSSDASQTPLGDTSAEQDDYDIADVSSEMPSAISSGFGGPDLNPAGGSSVMVLEASVKQSVEQPVQSSQIGNELTDEKQFDFGSLYEGVLPNVIKEAPGAAIYLGVYEVVRQKLSLVSVFSGNPLLVYLLSGAVGEVCGSVVRAPAEAVKIKTQTSSLSASEALASVFTPQGMATTFRSWPASLLREVPFGGIQLVLFEGLKTYVINSPLEFDVGSFQAEALFGAVAGLFAAFLTTPGDRIIALILSSQHGAGAEGSGEDSEISKYAGKNVFEVGSELVREGGPVALFKGATQRSLYWAPAMGIFLSIYCTVRQSFLHIL